MSAQTATMIGTNSNKIEETKQVQLSEPPPPPPPPRISAEDLKAGKKRKNSPDTSKRKIFFYFLLLKVILCLKFFLFVFLFFFISDNEEPKESKQRILEPLPPGVDQEISYTLPTSALEAGVIYGAQQTNPIYASTLAGAAAAAGIPLISHHHHHHHPHTALMQGQLVHYNQAYHQHLHNVSIKKKLLY